MRSASYKYRIATTLCIVGVFITLIDALYLFPEPNHYLFHLILDVFDIGITFYVLPLLQKVLSDNFKYKRVNVIIYLILFFVTSSFVLRQVTFPTYGLLVWCGFAIPILKFIFGLMLLQLRNSFARILRYYGILLIIKSLSFVYIVVTMKALFLTIIFDVASDLILATFFYSLDHNITLMPSLPSVRQHSNKSSWRINMEQFFSFKGRLRRKTFAIRNLPLVIVYVVATAIVKNSEDTVVLLITLLVIIIPGAIASISLTLRRLHDINLSGWFYLINLIPIVNILFAFYEIFKEGTVGPNQFGEDPKAIVSELNAA